MTSIRQLALLGVVCLIAGCQPSRPMHPVSQTRPASISRLQAAPKSAVPELADAADRDRNAPHRSASPSDGEAVPVDQAAEPSAWSKLWGPFSRPQRIPLPRTDENALADE